MSNKVKVFVSHAVDTCYKWINDVELVKNINDAELVIFTGGVDINPEMYNESKNYRTNSPNHERDYTDLTNFSIASSKGIPMIGICRGAQFLCVMAGGTLIQDVNGHYNDHKMITEDNEFVVTSSHHQMMNLVNMSPHLYDLLGYSLSLSKHYSNGDNKNIPLDQLDTNDGMVIEPEAVYFKNINALAVQYHPEYANCKKETVNYTNELIKKYLLTELVS